MIYEKRFVDLSSLSENGRAVSCIPDSRLSPKADGYPQDLHAKNQKKRRKVRPSGLRFSGIFVFAALFLFVYAADSRLFNYKIKSAIEAGLGVISEKTVSHTDNVNNSVSRIPDRTLYTLSYSEPHIEQNIPPQPEVISEPPIDDTASVEVMSAISQSTVDGVKYYPIVSTNLAPQNIFTLSNDTSFKIDMLEYTEKSPSLFENLDISKGPSVLILHTHACESYSEYSGAYPENAPTRNQDTDKNVVRVGREIATTLSEFGISSVHCDTLHDKDSFINAYSESADSVRHYLKQYPSIRFVIDVHRDAIIRDDGESVRAVTQIAGEDYAQLMFVVGTNELGHNHPCWKDNLSLAVNLQKSISDTYPNLCRSINLRNVPFNQQLSSGYLLLEVGTSANTLDEALRSARAFAQEMARVITASI